MLIGKTKREIAESIRSSILRGDLHPGQRMPTVRELSNRLGVSSDTVHQAYRSMVEAGLLISKVGASTTVANPLPHRYGAHLIKRSVGVGPYNEYELISAASNVRSFATNVPDLKFFQADTFLAELSELRHDTGWAFYYAPPAGDTALRHAIADWLSSMGTLATAENIVVTLGAQQAMSLVARELVPRGESVAIEGADYLGGKQRWDSLGIGREIVRRLAGEAVDLEALAKSEARFLYIAPTGCGASGRTITTSERNAILEIGKTVIEDASNSWICYSERPKDLAAMNPNVIQVGSFSNVLSPGLRIGYILASADICAQLASRQQIETGGLSQPLQMAMASYMRRGYLREHIRRVVPRYRKRRDVMLSAIDRHLGAKVTRSNSQAGFACRLNLDPHIDTKKLYETAIERGVAFTPGRMLFDELEGDSSIRLCFGNQNESVITEGVKILGEILSASA